MQQIVLIVHVLVSAAVIGLVLIQHGKGADTGAAFGGGSSSVFGSRGPTTLLTRLTAIFVTLFFLTSLSLAFLSKQRVDRRSVVERVQTEQVDVPSAPAVEDQGEGGLIAPTLPDTQEQ